MNWEINPDRVCEYRIHQDDKKNAANKHDFVKIHEEVRRGGRRDLGNTEQVMLEGSEKGKLT